MSQTKHTELWLGTQSSYESAIEGMAKAQASPEFKAGNDYSSDVLRQMYSVQDGVALITINGSLVDGSAGYGIFYGVTGYDDIRNALVAAISDPTAGAILLRVSSGGGAVAGVHELSQLVKRVSAIKPTVTYCGSTMCSAALWAAAPTKHVYVAETSISGSIGIIMVHLDRSKQMADMGIKATVIRAGTEKALSSPYETLSEKAEKDLQAKADALYEVFLNSMADARGITPKMADSRFGQGREFVGAEAVRVGLADAVGSYEDAFAKAQSYMKRKTSTVRPMAGATNSSDVPVTASTTTETMSHNQTTSQGTDMSKPLSAEQLTAIAAGVELPEAQTAEQIAADAATKLVADAAAAAAASKPTTPAAAGAAEPSALSVVQEMLAKAQADLATVRVEATNSNSALATLQAQTNSFVEIARASVKTMGLHFGLSQETVSAMGATDILAEHGRLATLFKNKFPVGSVAATSQEVTTKAVAFSNPAFTAMTTST